MLEAVKMAGAKPFKANLSWLSDNQAASALPVQLATPYCVIIPGSSPNKPSKRWSPARYAELSSRIHKLGITPYLVGTKSENAVIEEICTLSHAAESLVDKTNLGQLAQLCANAQFVIGNDTGPTFLAAKTGVATLMLMGEDTNPQMSSPTGTLAGYLHKGDIQSITVEEVITKMQELKGGLLP
jgi:ADP-heptose:LPS heptosyltransferase